jgi:hypothetical protein
MLSVREPAGGNYTEQVEAAFNAVKSARPTGAGNRAVDIADLYNSTVIENWVHGDFSAR